MGEGIDWLCDGEKYALIGLSVPVSETVPLIRLGPGLWASTNTPLNVPELWRRWLGKFRVDEIESCTLVLLAKMQSERPDVQDAEDQQLHERVWRFYHGLRLTGPFDEWGRSIGLAGSARGGEATVRSVRTYEQALSNRPEGELGPDNLRRAAALAARLEDGKNNPPVGGLWRLHRLLTVFHQAQTTRDRLSRLHQYCRCIDGMITSVSGKGLSQFKSRTELFIGPHAHALMGDIYNVRSNVEHLREHIYLERHDHDVLMDLAYKEAVVEHISRAALSHVIATPTLVPYFANTAALERFWALDRQHREALWGQPTIDLTRDLAGFTPTVE